MGEAGPRTSVSYVCDFLKSLLRSCSVLLCAQMHIHGSIVLFVKEGYNEMDAGGTIGVVYIF